MAEEAETKTAALPRRHGVSEATIFNWKTKGGGLEVSEAKRLEDENAELKRLLADTRLDRAMVKDLLKKMVSSAFSGKRSPYLPSFPWDARAAGVRVRSFSSRPPNLVAEGLNRP